MMYNYPFFSFPHMRRYPNYYATPYPVTKQPIPNIPNPTPISKESNSEPIKPTQKEKSSPKRAPAGFSFLNNFLHQEDRGEDEECFDIFGLKLYHDDILLIGLIFFLYKEEVKDQYLFFALILLLLS